MERRERGLVSRGKLESMNEGKRRAAVLRKGGLAGQTAGVGIRENVEKLGQLRAKKERLMYTVERHALRKGRNVSLISLDFLGKEILN